MKVYIIYFALIIFQFSCFTSKNIRTNKELNYKDIETDLNIYNNLDDGIKQAKKENKPILLIFTGYAVVNSRLLEKNVILKNNKIFALMKNKFINVWLYVDDSENGKKWNKLHIDKFNGKILPQIFVLDSDGQILDGGFSYAESKDKLLPMLQKY